MPSLSTTSKAKTMSVTAVVYQGHRREGDHLLSCGPLHPPELGANLAEEDAEPLPQARLLLSRLAGGTLGARLLRLLLSSLLAFNEAPHLSVHLTYRFLAEQGRRDSNPQPPVLETGALPIRATPLRSPRLDRAGKGRRARLGGVYRWAGRSVHPCPVASSGSGHTPSARRHHGGRGRCRRRGQNRCPGDYRTAYRRHAGCGLHPSEHQGDQTGRGRDQFVAEERQPALQPPIVSGRGLTGETAFDMLLGSGGAGERRGRQRTSSEVGMRRHGRRPSSISLSLRCARWSLTFAAVSEIPSARATSSWLHP